jgi:hypothetical protein
VKEAEGFPTTSRRVPRSRGGLKSPPVNASPPRATLHEWAGSGPDNPEALFLRPAAYTLRQARVDPSSSSDRSPPANWQKILARTWKERGKEVAAVAAELERAGK